jgi:hypothetical protein
MTTTGQARGQLFGSSIVGNSKVECSWDDMVVVVEVPVDADHWATAP